MKIKSGNVEVGGVVQEGVYSLLLVVSEVV
jgi:hypothetical protein